LHAPSSSAYLNETERRMIPQEIIKILIVEDEEIVRVNLEDFLEDEGFEAKSADSGEAGLEILEKEDFDVAIVDMRLPGIDGNTFIKKAKKMQTHLNIVIYTGSTFYSLPRELRQLGITEKQVLLKPLRDMGVLSQTIREMRESGSGKFTERNKL